MLLYIYIFFKINAADLVKMYIIYAYIIYYIYLYRASLIAMQETQVRSLGKENLLEEGMQPTSVFLPRESYGQRSLMGKSPWHPQSWKQL